MPSKKVQQMIDKANDRVSDNLDRIIENIAEAISDPDSLSKAYHQAISESPDAILEGLQSAFPKATNIPESTDALLETLGTTSEKYAELHDAYWIAQAQGNHDHLTDGTTAGDMHTWYFEHLMKSAEPLECKTLTELLERIDRDPEGKDLIEAATAQNRFFGSSMERYVDALNEHLNAGIETDELAHD